MAKRIAAPPNDMAWKAQSFRDHHADAEIICAHCRRRVIWTAFTVERFFGSNEPVEAMGRRLRCTQCRHKGAGVAALIRVRR